MLFQPQPRFRYIEKNKGNAASAIPHIQSAGDTCLIPGYNTHLFSMCTLLIVLLEVKEYYFVCINQNLRIILFDLSFHLKTL
jgi:hypothetical protein